MDIRNSRAHAEPRKARFDLKDFEMFTGKHLIAGNWVGSELTFESSPSSGRAHSFYVGTPGLVDQAANAAEAAVSCYSRISAENRAAFLRRIAEEIDARGDAITEIGIQETGLPAARLVGERGRTVGQLRLFADHIEAGSHLDIRHDEALSDRVPMPRSDIKMVQRPIGPVAVFGASNFPLAFSVAGGDTASALAAGCPVIVKGHSAHPGTSELVAQAIDAAIKATGIHKGVFSLIQGGRRDVGEALVCHPLIQAVGFTGSLVGGRALFDLCASRPVPIPFFGELGSINPMFVLPVALASRGKMIGDGWAASLAMGAGQFCTNPGIAVVVEGPDSVSVINAAAESLSSIVEQTMLTDGIASAYRDGVSQIAKHTGVVKAFGGESKQRLAAPNLFVVSGGNWLSSKELQEEVFGPVGIVVCVRDVDQMIEVAHSLSGQLTCTLHMDDADAALAGALLPVLERKAGRLIANGFPTGVEVCDAMVHGGPYPASTNFGATSVGTLSIRRWLRPVCYQDIPLALLPNELQS